MANFKGKNNHAREFQLGIWIHLKDDIDVAQESVVGDLELQPFSMTCLVTILRVCSPIK